MKKTYLRPFSLFFLSAPFWLFPTCLASDDIRDYAVKVYGASAPGSGVVISADPTRSIILTAAHVIQDTTEADRPYILTNDGKKINIVHIQKSHNLDLAQLTVETSLNAAPIHSAPHPGGKIRLVGFAQDSTRAELKEGTSEAQGFSSDMRPGGYSILHSANSRIGFSGGGIFNETGELVGIHGQADTSKLSSGRIIKTGIALAIPVNFLWRDSVQEPYAISSAAKSDLLSKVSFLRSSRKLDQALALISQPIAHGDNDVDLLLLKASLQIDLKRPLDALSTLNPAVGAAPKNPALLTGVGNAYFLLGDYANALLYYDRSQLVSGETIVEVSINKAKALIKLQRHPEALEVLSEAVKSGSAHAVFERARLHYDLSRYTEALEDLKTYSRAFPNDASMLSLTGLVHDKMGKKQLSRQYLVQALDADPENSIHIVNHAVSLAGSGGYDQSIRILRDLLSTNPGLNEAAANLAEILYWAGQKHDACEEAARLVEIGYQWNRGSWDQGFVAECSLGVEATQNSGPP